MVPLVGDTLPEIDPQGIFDLSEDGGKHYTEFPETTRLGWRGPMILASNIAKCPKITVFI